MDFTPESFDPVSTSSHLICSACGTLFPTSDRGARTTCHICDDPRQYVPRTGQSFTTLSELRAKGHRNIFTTYEADPRLTFIRSEPQVGIGQRAILIRTPGGNLLWDCVTLLDEETISAIEGVGGLKAIVISHPHFYSSHIFWARAFGCKVYVASEDVGWRTMVSSHTALLTEVETDLSAVVGSVGPVKVIKLGGHFPGSLVMLVWDKLLIADTLLTTPAGLGDWSVDGAGAPSGDSRSGKRGRPEGVNTFTFQWSVPNMIPLPADELARMWDIIRHYSFRSTHGAFPNMDIEDEEIKGRVLESMQIQTRAMGMGDHPIMRAS